MQLHALFNTLPVGPILRAMLRNRWGAMLLALQIAVTMAIVANALFIVQQRVAMIERDSGVDEANSFRIYSTPYIDNYDQKSVTLRDLDAIRNMPGVVNAIVTNMMPLGGGGSSADVRTEPDMQQEAINAGAYRVDEHALEAFDLELVAGEFFSASDVVWMEPNVPPPTPEKLVATETLAKLLFPDLKLSDIVGKTVYMGEADPVVIVGIVDRLMGPWVTWDGIDRTMLLPYRPHHNTTTYFVRAEPGMLDTVMRDVEALLEQLEPGRLLRHLTSFKEHHANNYQSQHAMVNILVAVMLVLVTITGLGIIGLTSFNVTQRRKQIGIRRALGATKAQILQLFMLENFLITSVGVALGTIFTLVLNIYLSHQFDIARLDISIVIEASLLLWLLGQIAVIGPAQKAAKISPAIATRTV